MFLVILAALFILPSVQSDGSGVQQGDNNECLDFWAFRAVPGVYSPTASKVTTTPGATFHVDTDHPDNPIVYLDFYDEDGVWLGSSNADWSGTVPAGAVTATGCIRPPFGFILYGDSHWYYWET